MPKHIVVLGLMALITVGMVGRLMPHEPNATPLFAIALIASLYLGKRWTLPVAITSLALSDALIGAYDWRIMVSVYVSFAIVALMTHLVSKDRMMQSTVPAILGASALFFLITNFAVWAFSPWYEKSVAGLLYAYELGFPFARNMLMGDVFYAVLFIGACEACIAGVKYLRAQKTARQTPYGVEAVPSEY